MKSSTRAAITLSVCATALGVGAGPLDPPAEPAPTSPVVEPRTAITALPFTIGAPGSYVVLSNLTGPGGGADGITIAANDVTLDLRGFTLTGAGGSRHGVFVDNGGGGSVFNVAIVNGTLTGWGSDGVNADDASNLRLDGVRAQGNGDDGLVAGTDALVTDCAALNNGGRGIESGDGCVVERCIAFDNSSTGISAEDGGAVRGCSLRSNGGGGILADGSSVISGNTLEGENNGTGITLQLDLGIARENVIRAFGQGIRVEADQCEVDFNNVSDSAVGIRVVGTENLVTRNRVTNATTPYDIPVGNRDAVRITPLPNFSSDEPWANYIF